MADINELHAALVKADAAGNYDDAKAIADHIKSVSTPQTSVMRDAGQHAGNIVAGLAALSGAPIQSKPPSSAAPSVAQGVASAYNYWQDGKKNLFAGVFRGGKDVIDTGAELLAAGYDKLTGNDKSEAARVKKMNESGKAEFAKDYGDSSAASVGRVFGNVGSTWPIGGMLGAPVKALGATRLGNALASNGMTTGAAPVGFTAKSADLGIRTAAGGTVGAVSAGSVNQDDAGIGATIGSLAPGVFKIAGWLGQGVYNAVKSSPSQAGKTLAKALSVDESQIPAIVAAANSAPESIVPGSKLTLSQALQLQGANSPEVRTLEKVISQSAGGKQLASRYADQNAARMDSLVGQGAQRYQGAAAVEGENTGNQLGALLRTQAADDNALVRKAWQGGDGSLGVHGLAEKEGAMLQIPADKMKALVADRMGDGYTQGAASVNKALAEAERIGTFVVPGIKPVPKSAGQTQSLEQAVRSAGGIRPQEFLAGEIAELGRKHSGTTGLVSKSGKNLEQLTGDMYERGFIPEHDSALLLEMLRGGGGRKVYAHDAVEESFQRMAEKAAGNMPTKAERFTQAVPFKAFQNLRSSTGQDAARLSEKTGNSVEAGVLTEFKKLMTGRADDASRGNLLAGESMSPELMQAYQSANDLTRDVSQRYSGNVMGSILRKPVGQNYTLNGNEITNKIWHGGAGLAGDVQGLKQVLSANNSDVAMNQLRRFIMTDAADKTTASGQFAAALPSYVEKRLPGLQEALTPEQLNVVTGVSKDIRNATAASADFGFNGGSDTFKKINKAANTGLLDSSGAKALASLLSAKGIGGESIRLKLSESAAANKSKMLAALLADPKAAAKALGNRGIVQSLDNPTIQQLRLAASRSAPVLATD